MFSAVSTEYNKFYTNLLGEPIPWMDSYGYGMVFHDKSIGQYFILVFLLPV